VVTAMRDDEFHRELRELFREDDKLRAEHHQYMAERKALANLPVSENGDAGLVYKDYDNSAPPAAAAAADEETDWSGWERWLRAHLDNEREVILDIVGHAMDMLAEQERTAIDRQLAELRAENAELKGMIGTVLRLYAGETKAADVIDLPDWRKRDVAA
jgi:hypothetical protein